MHLNIAFNDVGEREKLEKAGLCDIWIAYQITI